MSIIDVNKEIKTLQDQVAALEERNRQVDSNKIWETGAKRKLVIAGTTYLVTLGIFTVLEYIFQNSTSTLYRPFVNALIPTTGYALSTLALQCLKGTRQSSALNV